MSEISIFVNTLFMGVTLIPEAFFVFYMANDIIAKDNNRISAIPSSSYRPLYSTKLKVILTIIWIISIIIKLAIYLKYPNSFVMGNPNHPIMCLIMYALV